MSRHIVIGTDGEGDAVAIPEEAFQQHSLVFGGSGFGKTYLSYVLCIEQMKRGARRH